MINTVYKYYHRNEYNTNWFSLATLADAKQHISDGAVTFSSYFKSKTKALREYTVVVMDWTG